MNEEKEAFVMKPHEIDYTWGGIFFLQSGLNKSVRLLIKYSKRETAILLDFQMFEHA